jgi:hypothetical protein
MKKTALVLSLFSLASLFAKDPSSCECLLPENPIQYKQCPAAYNLCAAIRADFFIDASYTYWYAGEDGLEIGRSGSFFVGDDPIYDSSDTVLTQPFEYQSGFKVGAGWRKNDWILSGEYTWVRNTTSQTSAPSLNTIFTGVWLVAPWFLQEALDGGSLSGMAVESKWHLRMDIADLALSRPYYLGRHLTILPYGGLRAAWIYQKMELAIIEPPGLFAPNPRPAQPVLSQTGSHSWAIGPRFGSEAHVLLGSGFRVEGDIAFSLLFTKYTKIYHSETAASITAIPASLYIQSKDRSAVRPVVETGLGLGWGSYFGSNKYYLDFSADYDFSYWWSQNMMRSMLNGLWREINANGDLYLHGLTVSAKIGF